MARFFLLTSLLYMVITTLAVPIDTPSQVTGTHSSRSSPSSIGIDPAVVHPASFQSPSRRYEKFADAAFQYALSTVKVGGAFGLFTFALAVTDRIVRWAYLTAHGAFQYWANEVKNFRSSDTIDPEELALQEDQFVNEADGWESPVILEKRGSIYL
jgi:hypothetical protein